MTNEIACLNGQLLPVSEAKLPITDRGLTHGFGFFETMRVHNGIAFRLKDHLARLREACKSHEIPFPVRDETIIEKTKAVFDANGFPAGRARLTVTAGHGDGPWFKPSSPNWFLQMVQLKLPPESFYREGVDVATVISGDYGPDKKQPGKSLSYERHLLTRREAVAARKFEYLYASSSGEYFEGAGANLFVLTGRRLVTPPPSLGVVPGVARTVVFELAKKIRQQIESRAIHKHDFTNAEEAFLTNAIIGVMPIKSLDGNVLFKELPGKTTRKLMANYRAAIVDECGDIQFGS
ncbi:MAG: aminotransferase class IV [Planctomycetota bacterium]|jgi:branched-subunit amino acid aminotransferase/4-amino-4-deoxychorismate lyase